MATESTGLVSGAKAEQPLGKLATMALISGANSGYTIHIVSFVLVRLRREIEGISDLTILLACIIGGLIAPLVMHMPSMFVACLVAWRLVVGIGTGICVTVKPIYIAELAPNSHRGKLLALMGVANALSIMAAHAVDVIADGGEGTATGWWRAEILFNMALPVLLLLLLLHMPESPAFVGTPAPAATTAAGAANSVEAPMTTDEEEALRQRHSVVLRRAVVLCVALDLAREFTGGPVVAVYAKELYMERRPPHAPAQLDTVYGIGTVALFVLGNVLAAALIDRVGRRPPLLLGLAGVAVAMGAFAISDAPICLLLFGLAYGPIFSTWTVLLPELLPSHDRARLIGWLMALPFAFALAVASTYPLIAHGPPMLARLVFGAYGALALALGVFFFFALPETLGAPLDGVWEGRAVGVPSSREKGRG